MLLSAATERRFWPGWVFITPNAPGQTAGGQALPRQQNLPSEAASLGPLGAAHSTQPRRDRAALRVAPQWASTAQEPGVPRVGGGSGRVGSAHRRSLAARLRQSVAGNKKTARAAWKSPPGPTPEGDSGGPASRLSRDPGARLQEAWQPLHRRRHKSPLILVRMLQIQSVNT